MLFLNIILVLHKINLEKVLDSSKLLVLTYFSIVQEALSALYVLKHTRTFDGRFCSQSCDGEVTVEPEEVGNVKCCS